MANFASLVSMSTSSVFLHSRVQLFCRVQSVLHSSMKPQGKMLVGWMPVSTSEYLIFLERKLRP